jgi:hypothetical protein
LLRHANARRGLSIDGERLPLVIDAEFVPMVEVPQQAGPRELLPGSAPGSNEGP